MVVVVVVVVVYLPIYLPTYLPIYLSTYLPIYLSIYLSTYPSVCLPICLSASLKTKQFCESFLSFWTWQHQKRSNSEKNSLIFEFDNIKNETLLRDFLIFRSWQHKKQSNSARLLSEMESWVRSWRPRTNACCGFFHSICLKYSACNQKVRPGHTKCCTCLAK